MHVMITTDVVMVYAAQIAALLACLYMTWRSKRALNGMARGMMLLMLLLIVRRVDDMTGILDNLQTMILSSAVVVLVTYDIYAVYRQRDVFAMYLENRKKRIDEMENQRKASEARKKWDEELPPRWL